MPSAAILTTNSSGEVTFDYSDLNNFNTPAITALPLDASPNDGTVYVANLVSADNETAVVKVYATSAVTVAGISVLSTTTPAVGVDVHLTLDVNFM